MAPLIIAAFIGLVIVLLLAIVSALLAARYRQILLVFGLVTLSFAVCICLFLV